MAKSKGRDRFGAGARGTEGARGASGSKPARGSRVDPPSHDREPKEIPYFDDPQFKGKLDDIEPIANEIVSLHKRKKRLEDLIEEKNALIRAHMEMVNDKESWSTRSDNWTAMYTKPKPRKSLVPELLISAGVTLAQIKKGTKETPVTPFVQIRARGEE